MKIKELIEIWRRYNGFWNREQEKELAKEKIREEIRRAYLGISSEDLIMLSEFIYFHKIPIDIALKNLPTDIVLTSVLSDIKYTLELKDCGNPSYDLEDLKVVRHLLNHFPVQTALNVIEGSISMSIPINKYLFWKASDIEEDIKDKLLGEE